MSESDQQRTGSPLESERGNTNISSQVVSQIAGMAANEVAGVHMGGGASRATGGLLGNLTGSSNQTLGVSVEVGRTETAIELTMGVDYGRNILEALEEVRTKIKDRVESMTGLRITELNATINDIVFPDEDEDGGRGSEDGMSASTREITREGSSPSDREMETAEQVPQDSQQALRSSEPDPESETRSQETPPVEDATRELGSKEAGGEDRTSEGRATRRGGRSEE